MDRSKKGDVLAGRYEIRELLGEGGMGSVWLARDRDDGRDVAVKTVRSDVLQHPQMRKRFGREIDTLQRLDHPHILSYLDHGEDRGQSFLVTELVPGRTLKQAAADLVGQPDRVLLLGERIARALSAGHEAGVVHRDIKPDNVKLTDDGEPMILDYGLARWTGTSADAITFEQLTATGIVLGTAAYASPEQLRAEPVDRRSDIFSLGVMLYELSTGRRPYVGQSIGDLLKAMDAGAPPPLASLRSELRTPAGQALETVLDRALRVAPPARFQSMSEFADALGKCRDLHTAIPQDATMAVLLAPSLTTADDIHGRLVGRERELSLIDRKLEAACMGAGAALLLASPAGAGRTRLASEATQHAHARGFLCLVASVPGSDADYRADPIEAWLERAAAVFPDDEAIARARATGPRRGERALAALRGLSRRMPLLLVLEDVHQASATVLDLVTRIVSTARDHRVLLLLTWRTDAPPALATESLVSRLIDLPRVERIDLQPLSTAAIQLLAEDAYPGIDLDPTVAAELTRRSGGCPFFARSILRLLVERGLLVREGVVWRLEPVDRLPAPPEARELLRERLGGLAADDLAVLHAASVLGGRFEIHPLARVLDLPARAVETRLRVLARRSRVVAPDDDGWRFDQLLTRETLAASIPEAERRSLHGRAAEVLTELLGAEPGSRGSQAIAHHYLQADRPVEALPLCVRAGRLLVEQGEPHGGVEWLDRARVLLERRIEQTDEEQRGPLRAELADVDLMLAECLEGIGRHSDALNIFDKSRALAIAVDLEQTRVRSMIGMARASLARGDVLHAQKQAREARRAATRRKLERERALAMSVEAHALSRSDDLEDAVDLWNEAVEIFEEQGEDEQAADVWCRLGSHHYRLAHFGKARRCYEKADELNGPGGSASLQAKIKNALGGLLFSEGKPTESLPLFEEALAIRESIGDRGGMAASLHNIAYVHHNMGNRNEALRLYEQVIDIRNEVGERGRLTDTQRNYAEVLRDLGRLADALEQVSAAVREKRQIDDLTHQAACLTLLGEIELELGRTERAREAFAEVLRDFVEHDRDVFVATTGMMQLERISGHPDRALELARATIEPVPEGASPLHRLAFLRETLHSARLAGTADELTDKAAAMLGSIDADTLQPEARLFHLLAAADLAVMKGAADDARGLLEQALVVSTDLESAEHIWRIHRALGDEAEARRIIDEQARLLRSQELRAAYLAHPTRKG